MKGEMWKPIVGFEDDYEVSNLGRVRSLDRFVLSGGRGRTQPSPRYVPGRILKPDRGAGGHLRVTLSGSRIQISRLVAEAFIGAVPEGHCVYFYDGDPTNTAVENLRIGTPSDVARNRVRLGHDHGANKTACPSGHSYNDPANTRVVVTPSGGTQRTCRACDRIAAREWRAKNPKPKRGNFHARKTECPAGHEYTDENTYRSPSGQRSCLTCKRARERARGRAICKRCVNGVPHDFDHGTIAAYNFHQCRCTTCKTAFRERARQTYWRRHDLELEQKRAYRERNYETVRERERIKGAQYRDAANRRRKKKHDAVPVTRTGKWSEAEYAIARRDDITIMEMAYMLGRRPSAVSKIRNILMETPSQREERLTRMRERYRHNYVPVRQDYWTSAEDAVVFRDGLTDVERSTMLGRSVSAIRNRRSFLRKQTA